MSVTEGQMANVGQCTGGEDCVLTYCAQLLQWVTDWQLAEYRRGGIRMHPWLEVLHELHQTLHIAVCPRTRSMEVALIARCYALIASLPEPAHSRFAFLLWLELSRPAQPPAIAELPAARMAAASKRLDQPRADPRISALKRAAW
jgi:hypothetical protein